MKQLLQNLENGETLLVETPCPAIKSGHVLIHTRQTLISAGTEKMLLEFGHANLLDKARQQPEKVKMVLNKIRTDGLFSTLDAVKSKLSTPIPLGYSNVGIIAEVGEGVTGLKAGDRVVSNGGHAETVLVPQNLCAKIPDSVSDENAVFTIVASIALQGIRLANPLIGEVVAVIGTGLIGLITIQLLKAQGCTVIAIDRDDTRLALAKNFGAEICNSASGADPVKQALQLGGGHGVDAVIITASTKSNEPLDNAAKMSRQRGRIVLVGVAGLQIDRSLFYEKELQFQVSCSYGPGRYDKSYEDMGNDYPVGFVRWTENRNFLAILKLMSEGALVVSSISSHVFSFEDIQKAYTTLMEDRKSLGILLRYESDDDSRTNQKISFEKIDRKIDSSGKAVVGMIGGGNYAGRTLIPAFNKSGVQLHTLVTESGTNAVINGSKGNFLHASTDINDVFQNDEINTVVIATRHDSHGDLIKKSLIAGKHVLVEKPLCLTLDEQEEIEEACRNSTGTLMVGFNRRFSPFIEKMKHLLDSVSTPKSFVMTINAGEIPPDHWIQDKNIGGGRIIGECCHFIDLLRYLSAAPISDYSLHSMRCESNDTITIQLSFENGSIGSIHYFSNGHASLSKERLEVFTEGKVLQLDNYRQLKGYGWSGFKALKKWKQDKGQENAVNAFIKCVEESGIAPISAEEIFEVNKVTLNLANNN